MPSAGGSKSAPRHVPSHSCQSGGTIARHSRQSTPSKRSCKDMEISSVTEGVEVTSDPLMPALLKKGENPDAKKTTRILFEFNEYLKDCWLLGRHFTFNVDCFKCEKSQDKWVVRMRQDAGVNWQINSLMNNVKWNKQNVCVMPKMDNHQQRQLGPRYPRVSFGSLTANIHWRLQGKFSTTPFSSMSSKRTSSIGRHSLCGRKTGTS